jgi:hypothetical protein
VCPGKISVNRVKAIDVPEFPRINRLANSAWAAIVKAELLAGAASAVYFNDRDATRA